MLHRKSMADLASSEDTAEFGRKMDFLKKVYFTWQKGESVLICKGASRKQETQTEKESLDTAGARKKDGQQPEVGEERHHVEDEKQTDEFGQQQAEVSKEGGQHAEEDKQQKDGVGQQQVEVSQEDEQQEEVVGQQQVGVSEEDKWQEEVVEQQQVHCRS